MGMCEQEQQSSVRIYLLTAWQELGELAQWRFHLTDPHTGQRYAVPHYDALLLVLQQLNDAHVNQEQYEPLEDT